MNSDYVIRWFKKAENDLKVAKTLLQTEDSPTDIIGFHCQQAIEKYFKGYLTFKGQTAKKTHDIIALLNICKTFDTGFDKFDEEKLAELNFFAVEIRYPDEYYLPDKEEVESFFELANKIKEFVLKKTKIQID